MSADSVRVRWAGGDRSFAPGQTVTIGRDHGETIRLSDERVSRRHAELRSSAGGWLLVDLGSTSGTFVGGERVHEFLIRSNTTVRFGGVNSSDEVYFEVGATLLPPSPPTEVAAPVVIEPTELPSGRLERPGGVLAPHAAAGATEVSGATLQVQFAGRSRTLNPGETVRLGRDPAADLPTDNPTVSRDHVRVSFHDDAWYVEDVGSTRGTFLDGRKISSERLAGSMAFVLGPPDSGERLIVVAAGTSSESVLTKIRKPRMVTYLALAALVIAGLALTAVVVFSGDEAPVEASVADMRARTVRLSSEVGSGTGSIIDSERGLILTNAHVVRPDAPGQGVNYPSHLYLADGKPNFVLPESPREVIVSLTGEADEAATPSFRGEVIAWDGYLDLAVVQITETFGGTRIEEGDDLGLSQVEIGDSRTVDQDEEITVIGYPGISDSESAQVSKGVVSGFRDENRLEDKRAWINSDVQVNRGNSGGPAYNEAGELIAVVTQKRSDAGDSVSRIRPVHLAEKLVESARKGESYSSPFVAEAADEKLVGPTEEAPAELRWATIGSDIFSTSCRSRATTGIQSSDLVSMMFDYEGFPAAHQDVLVSVFSPIAGEQPAQIESNSVWPLEFGEKGCVAFTVPLPWSLQEGQTYLVTVDVGPNYERNLVEQSFTA